MGSFSPRGCGSAKIPGTSSPATGTVPEPPVAPTRGRHCQRRQLGQMLASPGAEAPPLSRAAFGEWGAAVLGGGPEGGVGESGEGQSGEGPAKREPDPADAGYPAPVWFPLRRAPPHERAYGEKLSDPELSLSGHWRPPSETNTPQHTPSHLRAGHRRIGPLNSAAIS